MASRLKLQEELETLLGTRNVYFQPPNNIRIQYPCIIYNLNRIESEQADNKNYLNFKSYTIMIITDDPDSSLPEKVLETFPKSRFDRQYKSDNLYHNVVSIYY